MTNYVKRRSLPIKQKAPENEPKKEELPVMYAEQMHNEPLPAMRWIDWTGPDLRLVLSPHNTVVLREGDSVLGWIGQNGRLEVYGYRPRTLH